MGIVTLARVVFIYIFLVISLAVQMYMQKDVGVWVVFGLIGVFTLYQLKD